MAEGIEEIQRLLPIRFPFLMVDRIVEFSEDSVKALKNVTINEPFFAGHFPNEAVMPASLILEGMAQTAGLLLSALTKGGTTAASKGYLVGVDQARFRKKVVPGDTLIYEAHLIKRRENLFKTQVTATVNGETVAEAVLLLAKSR